MLLRKVIVVLSAMLHGGLGLGSTAEAPNAPEQAQEPLPLEQIKDLLSTWSNLEANYEMVMQMAIESRDDTKRIDWKTSSPIASDSLTRGEVILHELAGAMRDGQPGPRREAFRNRFQLAVIDLYKQNKPGHRRSILLEILFHSKCHPGLVSPEPDTSKETEFFVQCLNDRDQEIRMSAFKFLSELAYTERGLYDKLAPVLESHLSRGVQDRAELENMESRFANLQSCVERLPNGEVWHPDLRVTEQDHWKLNHMSDDDLLEFISSTHPSATWHLALRLLTGKAPRRACNTAKLLALLDKFPGDYEEILFALARPAPETASDEIKAAEDRVVDRLESIFNNATDEGYRLTAIDVLRTFAGEGRYREEFKGGTQVHGEPHSRERIIALLGSYVNQKEERTRTRAQEALERIAQGRLKYGLK